MHAFVASNPETHLNLEKLLHFVDNVTVEGTLYSFLLYDNILLLKVCVEMSNGPVSDESHDGTGKHKWIIVLLYCP